MITQTQQDELKKKTMSWFRQAPPNEWFYLEPISISHKKAPVVIVADPQNGGNLFVISTYYYNSKHCNEIKHVRPTLSEYSPTDDLWIQYKIAFDHVSLSKHIDFWLLSDNPAIMFNNTIYLFNWTGQIVLFEINKTTHQCMLKLLRNDSTAKHIKRATTRGSAILIPEQQQIQIIGGNGGTEGAEYHIIYNIHQQIITKKHELTLKLKLIKRNWIGISQCGLVRIKNNKILLIGGRNAGGIPRKSIHLYDMNKNEWDQFPFNILPFKNNNCCFNGSCVSIFDGSIVLIFNGVNKSIYIYDCIAQRFYKSEIECPIEQEYNYKIFIINNDIQELLLMVWGYIRNSWNTLKLANQYHFLAPYLIKIIYKYSIDEWIHLFINYTDRKEHYQMNVMDIICNYKQ